MHREVKCWQECVVPNFVTSNCFIAQAYASAIASFLRDHLGRREKGWVAVGEQPEAGAGSAKLSYVLLQKLLKLSEYLPRPRGNAASDGAASADGDNNTATGGRGFCFKYVITDFSHANFGFWMNHPRLQELFTLGVVDFAVFDAEARPGEVGGGKGTTKGDAESEPPPSPEEGPDPAAPGTCGGGGGAGLWGSGCLRLELSGEELRPGDLDNPVIVVANYVFDSLKQDAFRCVK
ncbi:unnamed protein product [Ectocarpus sp. CCAP 1310/34]|nr:unnamed protein product [Ectocarpus sp. CCAP 1310/34]